MEETGRVRVLSTTAQIGDLAAQIGGERVNAWVLIQGGLDPHSYELVKGDGEKLERADVVFFNGLGLEHGAGLSDWMKKSPQALAVGDTLLKTAPERILHRAGTVDPHIWMDMSLWALAVAPMVERLSAIDPEGSAYYHERGASLRAKMEAAHLEMQATLKDVPSDRRYLVTSHDAFHYFARSYLADPEEGDWEKRVAAPEGLAPDGQLSSVDIQKILLYLKEHRIAVVFAESNVSQDSIRKIILSGLEWGLKVRICEEPLYGDAMDEAHPDYFSMMRHNAQVIAKHLGAK